MVGRAAEQGADLPFVELGIDAHDDPVDRGLEVRTVAIGLVGTPRTDIAAPQRVLLVAAFGRALGIGRSLGFAVEAAQAGTEPVERRFADVTLVADGGPTLYAVDFAAELVERRRQVRTLLVQRVEALRVPARRRCRIERVGNCRLVRRQTRRQVGDLLRRHLDVDVVSVIAQRRRERPVEARRGDAAEGARAAACGGQDRVGAVEGILHVLALCRDGTTGDRRRTDRGQLVGRSSETSAT